VHRGGRAPAENPSRSVVEWSGEGIEGVLLVAAEVVGVWEALAQEAVGVPVGAALPGAVGPSPQVGDETGVPAGALHEVGDGRRSSAHDEVAFPVPGHGPVVGLGWSLLQRDHAAQDAAAAGLAGDLGVAHRPPGPKRSRTRTGQVGRVTATYGRALEGRQTTVTRDDLFQIGEVAARTGLSLKSIRYYEEMGLLTSQRSLGGFRLYTDRAVERVRLIMHMKPLDFSLAEMKELLDAVDPFPGEERVPADPRQLLALVQHYRDEVEVRTVKLSKRLSEAQDFGAQLSNQLEGLTRTDG